MTSVSATDSYLNLLLNFPNLDSNTVLGYCLLVLMRIIPILVLAPFLGAKNVPGTIRMMFAIALTAIIIPGVLMNAKNDINFNLLFVGYTLKELFIGFIIGFFVSIPFNIAQSSGSLIDFIRGSQALQVTDPTTQSQTGPLGLVYNYILIVIFFALDGPFLFFNGLVTSFQIVPPDSFFSPLFFSLKLPVWKLSLSMLNTLMSLAIQLAAPSIVGILMTEMFLGIANRLAPQVQIVFLGIPLKSWVGIAFLLVAWYFILNQLGKESLNWLKIIDNTVQHMKYS
ncbi:MAG TPA: flagellar biosynthetic protein FliR [Chlamydiales bacterium]|nr:flagellar biosynthetic protein FliR [Chlamydiales bacterium]